MDEKRKFQRFPIDLYGRCYGGSDNACSDCLVIDIGREGIAIKLLLEKEIEIYSSLVLEIDMPQKIEPVNSVVSLMWIKYLEGESDFNYLAGGQLAMIDLEDKQTLLEYGYNKWLNMKRGL